MDTLQTVLVNTHRGGDPYKGLRSFFAAGFADIGLSEALLEMAMGWEQDFPTPGFSAKVGDSPTCSVTLTEGGFGTRFDGGRFTSKPTVIVSLSAIWDGDGEVVEADEPQSTGWVPYEDNVLYARVVLIGQEGNPLYGERISERVRIFFLRGRFKLTSRASRDGLNLAEEALRHVVASMQHKVGDLYPDPFGHPLREESWPWAVVPRDEVPEDHKMILRRVNRRVRENFGQHGDFFAGVPYVSE